jgi:hypothetical protein
MSHTPRRVFMMQVVAASTTLIAGSAFAQAKKLVETDPDAVALGYKEDSANVDGKKFPKHQPSQNCTNCMIWRNKGADAGSCSVFGNRSLSGKGWCSQWVKKG